MIELHWFWDADWSPFAIIFIFIPMLLLWGFALADLWNRREMNNFARVIWMLVIIWLPILGPITYMLTRPPSSEITYRKDEPIQ